MTRQRKFLGVSLALAAAIAPGTARADFPDRAFYVGIDGGGSLRLRDWDLGRDGKEPAGDAEAMLGLRLGMHLFSRLAAEVEFGGLPAATPAIGKNGAILTYDLNLLYHLTDGNWSPVVEAGFGAYQGVSGGIARETDPRGHVGLGLRGLAMDWLALRLDVRDVLSDGSDKWGANNVEILAGLDFFVWGAASDRDGDGIDDDDDACPDVRGVNSARGCPDRDGDGIADAQDGCPDQAGPVAHGGCPDADGDGIVDKDDACPMVAGPAEARGCPDSDGDGIVDAEDGCPKLAGTAATKGCPDADGDGLIDPDDKCPLVPGPVALAGCPDRDGDGIADAEDRCPDVAGIAEQQGCLPEAVEKKFTGAIRGINFKTGSAKILKNSFALLDEAVAVLREFPGVRLRIEGHTDNKGKPEANMTLSGARANAVRDYLMGKGIDGGRLEAVGQGDTRPIAPNETSKGRAANRRIEFRSIGGAAGK